MCSRSTRGCGPSTASSPSCDVVAPATRPFDDGPIVGEGALAESRGPAELVREDRGDPLRGAKALVAPVAEEGDPAAQHVRDSASVLEANGVHDLRPEIRKLGIDARRELAGAAGQL